MHPVSTLQVLGVHKRFGSHRVLDGVDLTVPSGRLVALLGPSGCGKTTLLRAIAGLEAIDSGSITLAGRVLAGPGVNLPPEKRGVGMVFQDWALFPHLTVGENVAYGLPRSDRWRVGEVLRLVGLEGLEDRMPATLSGGQQQRVAVARALAPRPQVLLFDEPFSNLDADLRVKVRREIRRLLKELRITALFVTHDQEEAFVVGDEVAVMRNGRILQQDPPAKVYEAPVDPWVAAFVGEANLVPGRAAGEVADTPLGRVPLAAPLTGDCTVLIRPEELDLDPDGDSLVTTVEFYGHDTSYRVATPSGEMLVRALAAPRFGEGSRVRLVYRGRAAVAYPPRTG
ncbi:MAG: iron ABC transporter ATP-binding protein [Acidimicrobiia bacterium]|nr:MAG: iron ABC transporter ATP-binding protein [Acidimicrobiia bacterium]